MKKFSVTLLLVLVFSIGVLAQTGTGQASTQEVAGAKVQDPVSREDLQKSLKKTTDQVVDAIKAAEKKSAAERAVDQEKAQKLLREQKEENDKKLAAIAAGQKQAEADRLRAEEDNKRFLKNLFLGLGATAVLAALTVIVIVARRPKKSPEVRVVRNHPEKDGILTDPNAVDLRKYATDNRIDPVPFHLTLKEGTFLCHATLHERKDPLIVKVENHECKIAWDMRQKKVASFVVNSYKQQPVITSSAL